MMTKRKKIVITYTEGDEHKYKVVEGHEFGQEETNEMLDEVFQGGDAEELKKKLIEKSNWGEE